MGEDALHDALHEYCLQRQLDKREVARRSDNATVSDFLDWLFQSRFGDDGGAAAQQDGRDAAAGGYESPDYSYSGSDSGGDGGGSDGEAGGGLQAGPEVVVVGDSEEEEMDDDEDMEDLCGGGSGGCWRHPLAAGPHVPAGTAFAPCAAAHWLPASRLCNGAQMWSWRAGAAAAMWR